MLQCVRARSATADHRLEACVWGLATATADGEVLWANDFLEALQDVAIDTALQRYAYEKCILIFHTIFGSLDAATAAAVRLTDLLPDVSASVRPSILRVCGYPYRLIGEQDTARAYYRRSWEEAEDLRLFNQSSQALANCATSFADDGDYETAWHFYERATKSYQAESRPQPPGLSLIGAEFAYMLGKSGPGDALVASVADVGPPRCQFDKLSLELFRLTDRGEIVHDGLLDRAITAHTRFGAQGWQDFNSWAIALALHRRDPAEAARFMMRHVASRRERWPISPRFRLPAAGL